MQSIDTADILAGLRGPVWKWSTPAGREIVRITIPGRPQVKQRPRVVDGRAYTPRATQQAEKRIGWLIRQAYPVLVPTTAPVALEVRFSGARRGDLSNLVKLPEDAMNAVVYRDDKQIVRIDAELRRDGEPRTEIVVRELEEG